MTLTKETFLAMAHQNHLRKMRAAWTERTNLQLLAQKIGVRLPKKTKKP